MSILETSDLFIDEFEETATFGGTDYDCIRYEREEAGQFGDFGMDQGVDLELCFKQADFATLPAVDQVITFNSTEYRIVEVVKDSDGSTFNVRLVDKYGNR